MSPAAQADRTIQTQRRLSRRNLLATTAGVCGLSWPAFMCLQNSAAGGGTPGKAKSCSIVYCWGGMSHLETWDPKPEARVEIRGEFGPISTATPGIQIGEHLPLLAKQTEKLAIIRSINNKTSAH